MPAGKGFQDLQLPEVPRHKQPYGPFSSYLRSCSAYVQTDHSQVPHQEGRLRNVQDSGIRLPFILSERLTVFLSAIYTPKPFSRAGRPLGKLSSITRYCGFSALTNGAMYVFFPVITGCMSSTPSFSRSAAICSLGRGVILSIMVHGNATTFSSVTYLRSHHLRSPLYAIPLS